MHIVHSPQLRLVQFLFHRITEFTPQRSAITYQGSDSGSKLFCPCRCYSFLILGGNPVTFPHLLGKVQEEVALTFTLFIKS